MALCGRFRVIELLIPEATPSLNVMWTGHWSRRYKTRKHWQLLVRVARLQAKVLVVPRWERARITIERTGAQILDHDNLVAGTKFVTDSLVREGFIVDDSPAHIGRPEIHQLVHETLRQTRVRIEHDNGGLS